jgi:RNA polymerase sigma-70 factor (ECF subfamily)
VTDDVLQRFTTSDPSALADLYAVYGGAVFTVSMSILGDRDLAADASQETFIKAWRAAASFDASRPFAPWIYAIARRTAVDMWRRQRRHRVEGADADSVEMPPEIAATWVKFEVRAAVDRLPEPERDVVRLTHLGGLTHAETAERLGVPVGTVKSRSSRAHSRLASWLGHLEDEK